jgi:hypothetical protein
MLDRAGNRPWCGDRNRPVVSAQPLHPDIRSDAPVIGGPYTASKSVGFRAACVLLIDAVRHGGSVPGGVLCCRRRLREAAFRASFRRDYDVTLVRGRLVS